MTHPKLIIYALFDFLALNFAIFITYYWFFNETSFFSKQELGIILLSINLLWFSTLLYSNRIYKQFEYIGFIQEVKNLIPNYVIYIFLCIVLSIPFFQRVGFKFSFYLGLFLFLLLASRAFIKFAISYRTLNYVTIGYCETLPKLDKALSQAHNGKTNHLGAFGSFVMPDNKYLGSINDIIDYLQKNKVNLILYVSNTLPPALLRQLMHYAKHNFIEFKIVPFELDFYTEGAKLELHHGIFVSAKDEFEDRSMNRFLKRFFDIVFSLAIIISFLSWFFPLICLIIILESKGKPVYIQNRIGFRGKIFKCLKFRSMTSEGNSDIFLQAQRNDIRITKVGEFLRKSNIDELPQFINVLLGDMSVVGPRPHPIALDVELKSINDIYNLRHYIKPGITGWAQVNGWRGPTVTNVEISNRTKCDLWYIKNRSFFLDIKIVFLTLFGSKAWRNAF